MQFEIDKEYDVEKPSFENAMFGKYVYIGWPHDVHGNGGWGRFGHLFRGVSNNRLHLLTDSEAQDVFSPRIPPIIKGSFWEGRTTGTNVYIENVDTGRYVTYSWTSHSGGGLKFGAVPWDKFLDLFKPAPIK
jgi:hypothetical protein